MVAAARMNSGSDRFIGPFDYRMPSSRYSLIMRLLPSILLLALACAAPDPNTPRVSKEPISVRGWIADVAGSPHAPFQTPETEAVRKLQLFQSASVWVDNAPYVSGGVAENGSFILLDVPPGNITITFNA